jgi:hypothetical protein
MDLNSERDLRDYGENSAVARAAGDERRSLLGADIGMERERGIRGLLTFTPSPTRWLGARISLGTRFAMTRDPQTRFLLPDPDNPSQALLPARLASSQQLSTGVTLDFGQLARSITGDSSGAAAVGRILAPLDVNYSRGLLSTFSAANFTPAVLYQVALGGSDSFRHQDGQLATIAGASNTVSAAHAVRPWRGATITNRASFTSADSWTALLDNREHKVEGSARTFPDFTVRLERGARDGAVLIRSATAQAGLRHTVRNTRIPSLVSGIAGDRSRDEIVTIPASFSINWAALGGFSTSVDYNLTLRDDLRPGIRIEGETKAGGASIARVIPAGTFLGLSEDLRTRLFFTGSATRSTITSATALLRSRLVDNGVYSVGFTADSDVSETMVLSVGASQKVTYDRNFNRRVTQTIFSAILNIDFSVRDLR